MKAKILAKLKQEYSALGLGDEYLTSKAESLAATGLVTDENIDAVVACQRKELEGLQSISDKRVTAALEKERKRREDEETRKKAEEEAKRKAAEEEEARRKAEEEAKKKQNPTGDPRLDEFQKRLDEMVKKSEEEAKRNADLINALTASKTDLESQVKALSDKNAAAEAAAARAERAAKIRAKAKELGVPEWRIEEGFVIAEDATDEAITETLTKVANNIGTNLLPGNRAAFPMGDNKPDKAELAALAATIVK